jgi:2-iminobutanoate/2-iminopropanoate deaminase
MTSAGKAAVRTGAAPSPAGAYSQAVTVDGWCFVSGQVGWRSREDGLEGGVEQQTRRALQNLEAILAAAGASLRDVVRTTVYLRDFADFAAFNEAYAQTMAEAGVEVLPARTTVGASIRVAVEIDAVAKLPGPVE